MEGPDTPGRGVLLGVSIWGHIPCYPGLEGPRDMRSPDTPNMEPNGSQIGVPKGVQNGVFGHHLDREIYDPRIQIPGVQIPGVRKSTNLGVRNGSGMGLNRFCTEYPLLAFPCPGPLGISRMG